MPSSTYTRRRVATNTFWNLLGMIGPMAAALWAIPILVRGMGTDRFGLMSIVWLLVGYFSLFDLGIGRALTKMVAERHGKQGEAAIPQLCKRGMQLMGWLGVAGGALVALLSPWLAMHVLKMPSALQGEALASLWILSATVPFVIVSAGSVGILQGLGSFREITWVRLPLGILNYVAPVMVLQVSQSLVAVTLVVAITRIVAAGIFWWQVRAHVRAIAVSATVQTDVIGLRGLLSFGGWVTVSNVIGPVMMYFDRFVIGAVAGTAAVAYYTTPYEVVSRYALLPAALLGVLFPALASTLGSDSDGESPRLYAMAGKIILLLMLVPVAWTVLFAPEGLTAWLGPEFARQSADCARWLAIGVFVNALAGLPFIALQGQGRPDITAKLHAVELIAYLPALWFAIKVWGITGAAAVWALRNLLDFMVLTIMCEIRVPALRATAASSLKLIVPTCIVLLACAFVPSLQIRVAIALAITTLAAIGLWQIIMRAGLLPSFKVRP